MLVPRRILQNLCFYNDLRTLGQNEQHSGCFILYYFTTFFFYYFFKGTRASTNKLKLEPEFQNIIFPF